MKFIFFILFAFSCFNCFSKEINREIINYDLFEQIHINTDRNTYLSGETIWLNVNTYEGNLKIPVNLSKIAYIELFNQDNIAVQQEKIFLQDGSGSGYIEIPRHLKTDYYYIRAYTNYMKNFGCESFYHQRINVINPFIEIKNKNKETNIAGPLNITFFPEGDFIMLNQQNLITFQVTDNEENGINFKGYLTDNQGMTIDTIKTIKNGFGYFELQPFENKKYFVEYFINNEKYINQLPEIQNDGIKIKVNSLNDSIKISLISNNTIPLPLKLTASYPGLEFTLNNIYEQKETIAIPNNKFYSGICELKLYNNKKLLSARPIYINDTEKLDLEVSINKNTYNKRENVNVGISARAKNSEPISANLGISVSFCPDSNELINSLHKKYSFTSQFYKLIFVIAENHPKLLDTLLLACKQKFIIPDSIVYLPEMHGDLLQGTIYDRKSKLPINNVTVYQSLIDSVGQLKVAKTNEKGEFYFILNKYNNNAEIVLSVPDTTNKFKIEVKDEFYNKYCKIIKENYVPDKTLDKFIERKMINIQVNDAYSEYIPKIKNTYLQEEMNFYGNPDVSYLFSDYIKLPNVDEFIFEIVHGVIVVRRNKKRQIRVISNYSQNVIGENPLILIDGVPINDHKAVLKLRPDKLKSISAVLEQYFYHDQKYDGILDIVSVNEDLLKIKMPHNSYRYELKGTQRGIDFPDINTNRVPNYSNALFWNGNITTNNEGKVDVSFNTGDLSGTYLIKCFGYSENGIFGINFEKKIEIK
ncbi:hypothetical protein ACFLTE_00460 [Bacteroidota bacterium]